MRFTEKEELKGLVIDKGEEYFTYLKKIFDSIEDAQKNYNWLITGYECYPQNEKYIEKLSREWCWMTGEELTEMIEDENFQWIWGVFSAFPKTITRDKVLEYELPKADGNAKIWENPISMQNPLSILEIVAWDSSLTVVVSKYMDIIIDKMKEQGTKEFQKQLEEARKIIHQYIEERCTC